MTAVTVFDQLRATVGASAHVVARFPGVLLVIRRTDGPADEAVPALLRICRDVTAAAPRSPGRPLARRLSGWLAQNEQAPGFGTLAATDDGVAIFLYGEVTAWADGLELSGSTAAFTVDRLVEWPSGPLTLAADGSAVAADPAPDWLGLQRGVVEGGGTTLHPGPGRRAAAPARPGGLRCRRNATAAAGGLRQDLRGGTGRAGPGPLAGGRGRGVG